MSVSNEHSVLDVACVVSDSTSSKFRIMQGDTTDTTNAKLVVKAATAETTKPLCISQAATTAADEVATQRFSGISMLEVNGDSSSIAIGDSICATTGGVGIIASTPDAAQQWAIGYALAPSSADGDEIPLLIDRHLIVKGTA